MASNQQRPTDDVLGHGGEGPEDATAGDDRGKRNPDDTEGHMPLRRAVDTEATDEDQAGDDVAGHSAKVRLGQDTEATDDVTGHASKVRLGQDTEAVDEDQAAGDDAEGHGGRFNF